MKYRKTGKFKLGLLGFTSACALRGVWLGGVRC